MKASLRGKFIVLSAYINRTNKKTKQEKSYTSNLTTYLKALGQKKIKKRRKGGGGRGKRRRRRGRNTTTNNPIQKE